MFKYLFKFILIGDYNTGKTAIFERFMYDKFKECIPTTIGVQFTAKLIEINDFKVKINLWDTSGQERFKAITNSYLRDISCALVTFDMSNLESFNNVSYWIKKARANNKDVIIILVATKSDLKHEVSKDNIVDCVMKNDVFYCETSSKDNININELFIYASGKIVDNINSNIITVSKSKKNGIRLNEEYDKKTEIISKVNLCC